MVSGTYRFKYTITGTCITEDFVDVTIYSAANTATAGPDQQLCDATSFQLAGNDPGRLTGTWTYSGPSGGSFSPNSHAFDAVFNGAIAGTYIFTWTITNSTCRSLDEVRIDNYASPSTAAAGSDQSTVCTSSATMAAPSPIVRLGEWTLIGSVPAGATPAITSPILSYTTITNLIPTTYPATYTFRWTVSNGPICDPTYLNYDNVNLTVVQPVTTANAGADQELLCGATEATLTAVGPLLNGTTGKWTKVSGPGTPTFLDDTQLSTTVSGLVPGSPTSVYVFKWTTTLGTCTSEDEVTITIVVAPTTVADFTNFSQCLYLPLSIPGTTPITGTGLWTQTSGAATIIVSPTSPTTVINGTTVGTYQFTWTISNGNCTSIAKTIDVTILDLPTVATAGPDQSLCFGTTTATLAGNSPSLGALDLHCRARTCNRCFHNYSFGL